MATISKKEAEQTLSSRCQLENSLTINYDYALAGKIPHPRDVRFSCTRSHSVLRLSGICRQIRVEHSDKSKGLCYWALRAQCIAHASKDLHPTTSRSRIAVVVFRSFKPAIALFWPPKPTIIRLWVCISEPLRAPKINNAFFFRQKLRDTLFADKMSQSFDTPAIIRHGFINGLDPHTHD